ncbi:MAG: hypothetical protein Q4A15_09665, partial [Prevotellaceae bacterium]|nr:hypothetical protein [Prevotellaceae bacterium]
MIVLVPMLVLSSIFVDMSRIKLAESVAKSSGELTLNTALTNYDAVLKDMYGLFATSQNTDELFENLENYYRQCIEAAGVAEADADNYVDQIMQFVRSQTGTDDLMNMNLTSFEVTKPTGGSLANPAVLKSQIVEFMKYRAPINLGTGIFDALSSMKNLKKQNELVKNKNKFYDQQTSMMEKLESVWNDLENYQYRDAVWPGDTNSAHGFPQGSYMSDYAARMNDCVEPLKTSIAYVVRYLYFADTNYGNVGYSASEPFGVSVNTSPSDSANSQVWTVTQTDKTTYNVKTNPDSVTVDELKSYLKTAYKAIKNVSSVTSEYETIAQGNASLSDTEKIRIVTKVNSTLNSGYQANIKNLVANMVNLKNAYEAIEPDDIKDLYVVVSGSNVSFYDASTDPEGRNKPSGATKMSSFIQSQLSSHLTVDSNGNITDNDIRIYNGLMSRAKQYYSDTSGIVSAAKTYVNQHADAAYNYASSFDSFLEEKIGKLQNAATTLTTIKSELNNSESNYNKALSAWKSSANGLSGDTMGQENMSEIQKLEKVLTVSKVDKLITRVNDAKASLESVKSQVAGYKALGKSWKDFVDSGDVTYSKVLGFLSAAQKQKIDNVAKSSQIATETVNGTATAKYDKAYDSVVSELTSTVLTQTIKTSWSAAEAAKSPDLTKNQVELYTWLYNNFCNQSQLTSKYGTARGHGQYTQGTEPAASTNISDHKGDADSAQSNMDDKAKSNKDTATKSTETPPNRNYNTSFLP